jgi:hypothetical protein
MVFDKWSGKCSIPQHKENLKPEKITESPADKETKQL